MMFALYHFRDQDHISVIIRLPGSIILDIYNKGLLRYPTTSPQSYVDYDKSGQCVKIIGVDLV